MVSSRWFWLALQLTRRIWVRATLFSILAVVAALTGIAVSPYIPEDLPTKIGADAVDHILAIIASSMLTVTTFSLSVMVSAYSAATSNVTPRATQLVIEDSTTQNVLSTFVGSFLFSLVGIIVLSTGAYGARGRLVLFVATIVVIVLIVVTLLRWIDHLSQLGRVTQTTARVEDVTASAFRERHENPFLGGQHLVDRDRDVPAHAMPVYGTKIGYVRHLDIGLLAQLTADGKGQVYVNAIPGDFVATLRPLAWIFGVAAEDGEEAVRNCFTIGDTRSFDQDPRFGASVLAEIASRALSPGINDPGTAIDVIGRAVRLMAIWVQPVQAKEVKYPTIFVPAVEMADLFDDLFIPIARDGAAIVEVGLRLQKGLAMLAQMEPERFGPHARRQSRDALDRAMQSLVIAADKSSISAAAELVGS